MTTLILNNQFKQFDANGNPLAAGKIYTYVVGTTTNKLTYQDEAKVAEHENPIILDAWGEATIWIDGDTKFVVTDSDDVTVRTYPSFADTVTTGEFPVVSSPEGAVLRSTTTDTGYIKIQLPMGEWPNTKMMFDVMVYTDDADEAFTLTLGGYADSNTSAWLTTTAITNGITDYTVQFGNDGTYPAIYIGAVDSEWIKPQIAVTNFLAGEFSYDWDTWDNGWAITVTTSLGTITSTDTATSSSTWGAWATVPGVSFTPTTDDIELRYRVDSGGSLLHVNGQCQAPPGGGSYTAGTLPTGSRPKYTTRSLACSLLTANSIVATFKTSGLIELIGTGAGAYYNIDIIIPLD